MWILGKTTFDFLFLLIPGFLVLCFSPLLKQFPILVLWLFHAFIDAGHVYISSWRTWWHPAERKRSKTYFLTPLCIFVVVSLWLYSGGKYFWTCMAYATTYHTFRQYQGVLSWYGKLNGRRCKTSMKFLFLLVISSFVLMHFREGIELKIFTKDDLFSLSSFSWLFNWGLVIYIGFFISWIIFEIKLYQQKIRELNRFLFMLATICLSSVCYLYCKSVNTIFLPIIVIHGTQYFALMCISLPRTRPGFFPSRKKAAVILFLTGIGTALYLNSFYFDYVRFTNYLQLSNLNVLLTALFVVPMVSHYIFDGLIWKGNHPEANLLYQND